MMLSKIDCSRLDGGSHEEVVRFSIGWLLEHDRQHGPEQVADGAVALWRWLAIGGAHLALDAELAECAGWLLFHADRQPEARAALVAAERLARLAGERPFQAFVLDLLAMHAIEVGDVGEALGIADELLTRPRVPPGIPLMAHVRTARAYAIAGDGPRALDAIGRAKADVLDSVSEHAPAWARWIDAGQVAAHEREVLTRVGRGDEALELALSAARDARDPRQILTSLVTTFGIYARLRAWPDVERTAHEIAATLPHATSALARSRFRRLLRLTGLDAPERLMREVRSVQRVKVQGRRL